VGDVIEELRDLDVRRAGVATGRRAERVVVAEQQLEVQVPHRAHLVRLRLHDHPLGGRRRAARRHLARALDLDEADATGGRGRQARLVAEGRDVDAGPLRRFEDRVAALADDLLAVDRQGDLLGPVRLDMDELPGRRRHQASFAAAFVGALPERTTTASNLHTWRQVSHLMQAAGSMTWGCLGAPVIACVGHFLAQRRQPVQAAGSMA